MKAALVTITVLVAFLTSGLGLAQTSRYPVNEQPMYGNIAKNDAMVRADEELIRTVLSRGHTRETGSMEASDLGFHYLVRNDMPTAMKRFNQAWLLDPENGAAYHGFALILLRRDHDKKKAEQMFKLALAAKKAPPGTYSDYGRFLILSERHKDAVSILQRGLELDADMVDLHSRLGIAMFRSGDHLPGCTKAREWRDRARREDQVELDKILRSSHCRR